MVLKRRDFLHHTAQGLLALGAGRAAPGSGRAQTISRIAPLLQRGWRKADASECVGHVADLKVCVSNSSTPRVLAQGAGVRGHCWYPDLLRFSTGEWMLTHSLNDDSNSNMANTQAVYISADGNSISNFI